MSRRYAVEPKRELSTSPSLSLNTVIDLSLLLFNLLIRIRSTVTSYEIFCASKKNINGSFVETNGQFLYGMKKEKNTNSKILFIVTFLYLI
jgi:hypothetical protein